MIEVGAVAGVAAVASMARDVRGRFEERKIWDEGGGAKYLFSRSLMRMGWQGSAFGKYYLLALNRRMRTK